MAGLSPVRCGADRRGMAWQSRLGTFTARLVKAQHVQARQASLGTACSGAAWTGSVRQGRRGEVWHGASGPGLVRMGEAGDDRLGMDGRGRALERKGKAGTARRGETWSGSEWRGKAGGAWL